MVNTKLNDSFPLQEPLTPAQYGNASLVSLQGNNKHHGESNKSYEIYRLFCTWQDENPFIGTWYSIVADVSYDKQRDDDDDDDDDGTYSIWASKLELKIAIRKAFDKSRYLLIDNPKTKSFTLSLQRLAIDAIHTISQQYYMQKRSSVSIDTERGIRVVATSKCIGTTSVGGLENTIKYRFSYRMRVENLIQSSNTVQLLGRTWIIQDISPTTGKPVGDAQHVHAPNNGAVGHLPVLQPGQVFEYISGCDLFTKHGTMKGSFHMAIVDGSTRSAIVGDPIDVFGEQNPIVFEMPVHEFALEADDTDG
jgi:uncharacterized protein affecting Mg2+/Co2+ transport